MIELLTSRLLTYTQVLQSCAEHWIKYMKCLTSETVRSDWTRWKSDERLLQWLRMTLERLGFRGQSCHVNVLNLTWMLCKFACLKPTFIWVYLESFLIYLVRRDSGAPVWMGCNPIDVLKPIRHYHVCVQTYMYEKVWNSIQLLSDNIPVLLSIFSVRN